jgi:hypothetical protein
LLGEKYILTTKRAQELELCQSPFYNQKVVKEVLEDLSDKEWQNEWTRSGRYHSITAEFLPYFDQTKKWFQEAGTRMRVMTYGRPTVGFLIQFITGHGWFGQHQSKFDEDFPYRCRFATLSVKTQSICGPHVGTSAGSDMQFKNYVKRILAAFHLINLLCGQSRN